MMKNGDFIEAYNNKNIIDMLCITISPSGTVVGAAVVAVFSGESGGRKTQLTCMYL